MKKVLSVILAIMMLFGAMSLNVSATDATSGTVTFGSTVAGTVIDSTKHVIIEFNFNGGTSRDTLYVYDIDKSQFVEKNAEGAYLMLPSTLPGYDLRPGQYIKLPVVVAPENQQLAGWRCTSHGNVLYGQGDAWLIPSNTQGQKIVFWAEYTTAVAEEDTMAQVLGILMKVFGTIIGVLFLDGSAQAGIELMEKMLGGLF